MQSSNAVRSRTKEELRVHVRTKGAGEYNYGITMPQRGHGPACGLWYTLLQGKDTMDVSDCLIELMMGIAEHNMTHIPHATFRSRVGDQGQEDEYFDYTFVLFSKRTHDAFTHDLNTPAPDKVLVLSTHAQATALYAKYVSSKTDPYIDWAKVAKDFAGFELRFTPFDHMPDDVQKSDIWLYNLDVPSGCIWRMPVVKPHVWYQYIV